MREYSVVTTPPNGNIQTDSTNPVDHRHGVQGLKDDFERSLESANGKPEPDHSQQQEDISDTVSEESSVEMGNEETAIDTLWSPDLPANLRDPAAGEQSTRDSAIAGNLASSLSTENTHTAHASHVYGGVSKLLAHMEQMHNAKAIHRWQFEWISGGIVKMSLRIGRNSDGEFGLTIDDCESDYCRREFMDELNRRLEEKQYQVVVTSEND